eukprot:gene8417-242_t
MSKESKTEKIEVKDKVVKKDVKKLYEKFCTEITSNPEILKVIYTSIQQNDMDLISRSLYNISKELGNTDKLIEIVVEFEFQDKNSSKQTALRTNSLPTKILDNLMKETASKYTANILQDPIMNVLKEKNNLEIDPHKIENKEMIDKNLKLLNSLASQVIEAMLSEKAIETIPPKIRDVCRLIEKQCKTVDWSSSHLLANILFLRLFNITVVFPDQNEHMKLQLLNPQERRNLILISKIVQNLANGYEFKEEYMIPLNDILQKYSDKMNDFFTKIVSIDEEKKEQDSNFTFELSKDALSKAQEIITKNESHFAHLKEFLVLLNSLPAVRVRGKKHSTVTTEQFKRRTTFKINEIAKTSIKYGWKSMEHENPNKLPFPLCNFCSFESISYDEYGIELQDIFIHGGQGRFSGKSDLLYRAQQRHFTDKIDWKLVETKNSPPGRSHHSISSVMVGVVDPNQKSVYMFGGNTTYIIESFSNDFYELDLNTFTWKTLKKGPNRRAKHTICSIGNCVYLFGGTDEDKCFGDFWKYDALEDKWEKITTTTSPGPRHSHIMKSFQNNIYIVGGMVDMYVSSKEIWQFNVYQNQWRQMNFNIPIDQPISVPLYLPARNGSATMIGNKIVMFGGETLTGDSNEESFLNDFLVFDTESQDLFRTGDITTTHSIYMHQIHWTNDKMILIGGSYTGLFYYYHHSSMFIIDESLLGEKLTKGKLFSTPILDTMKLPQNVGRKVPLIVEVCVDYLMNNGVDSLGIFRLSGRHYEIYAMCLLFENNGKFIKSRYKDCNSIAVVLKRYINSLPEPLLTFELFEEFNNCQSTEEFRSVLKKLPENNYEFAKLLFKLLHTIHKNSKETKMGASNLLILFNLSLHRKRDHVVLLTREKDTNSANVVMTFIQNYPELFE